MAKRSPSDELDRAVEAVLNATDPALSRGNRELSELLQVATSLRELPRESFKAKLARELRPPIAAHDLREVARTLAGKHVNRFIGSLDQASIVVSHFEGQAPWERHPGGDELIVVLDGGGHVTVLTDDGPVRSDLRPGMVFVCPKGLWHRPVAEPAMTALYVTPLAGGEHSWADDPRVPTP